MRSLPPVRCERRSESIVRYLTDKYRSQIPDSFYPKDLSKAAKVRTRDGSLRAH